MRDAAHVAHTSPNAWIWSIWGDLQLRRTVDQLDALHYMHTNMLRVPLMYVDDSRDVQASVAPMPESLRTCAR